MNKTEGHISQVLETFERKIGRGETLDGPALGARILPSDMHIAGYGEDRRPDKTAAVLIPLIGTGQGHRVLFTKRPESMKIHPGQISFPGGRQEAGDKTLNQTALREAREEIGLTPDQVKIFGRLAPYCTITGFEVTPVLGQIGEGFLPKPDPREVEEIFDAPLSFFLNPENLNRRERLFKGKNRAYYFFDFEEYHIWGATAAMLINFREALFAFAGKADG